MLFILLLGCAFVSCAQNTAIQSDKLAIIVKTYDGKPGSWLRFYGHDGADVIPITLEFNIDNVRAVLLTDEHAVKGRCGQAYSADKAKNILYLSFAAKKNLHRVKTRIGLPCLYQRTSILNLRVMTDDNREFYTRRKITIDPRSSAQQILDAKIKNLSTSN